MSNKSFTMEELIEELLKTDEMTEKENLRYLTLKKRVSVMRSFIMAGTTAVIVFVIIRLLVG